MRRSWKSGPGLGSLTLGLLDAAAAVVAVEIDPVLAAKLPATVQQWRPAAAENFHLVQADAMKVTELPVRTHVAGGQPALQRGGPRGSAPPAAFPEPAAWPGHGPGRGSRPAGRRPGLEDLRRSVRQGSLVQPDAQSRRDRHERLLAGAQDPLADWWPSPGTSHRHHAPPANRSLPSSMQPSPSAGRPCGPHSPAGPGGRRKPSAAWWRPALTPLRAVRSSTSPPIARIAEAKEAAP